MLQARTSLKEHHRFRYSYLLGSGELNAYLYQVDMEANELYESLIVDFAKAEGIDEHLKAADQMKWIQKTRNIAERAREIIEHEMIF